jgi:hypothetical protein
MCDIGKPIEIVECEPLVLPAPLPGTTDPEGEPKPAAPVLVPVPVELDEEIVFEEVTAYIPER